MAHSTYDEDDKKGVQRRDSAVSSVSAGSVMSNTSKTSWTSLSDLSLYNETSGTSIEKGARRSTSTGSSRASSAAGSCSSSWSSAMRAYRASPSLIIPNDRISNAYLRRITAREIEHYQLHSTKNGLHLYSQGDLTSDQTHQGYGQPISRLLPKPASLFMIEFTISRSTGNLTRSLRLSHCNNSGGDDLHTILKAGQLKLASQDRVRLPQALAIASVSFPYGLGEPYATHASLSLVSNAIDTSQTIKKAYITSFAFYSDGDLHSINVKGRRSKATGPTMLQISKWRLDVQALPATFKDLDQESRDRWLGPFKMLGKNKVYRDWIVTDLTFGYNGHALGGFLKRIRGPTTMKLPPPPPPPAPLPEPDTVEDRRKSKSKGFFRR